MKVLIISHLLARTIGGGVAMRAVALARALVREGVDVRVLTTNVGMTEKDDEQLRDLAVTALPVMLPAAISRFAIPAVQPSRVSDMVRDADVLLLFNHWTVLNALAFDRARRHGVPHIVCPSGALGLGTRSHGVKRAYNAAIGTRLVREAASGVATTELERASFAPYGLPDARIHVIPNAVDLGETGPSNSASSLVLSSDDVRTAGAALRHTLGVGDAPLLLFMGRLNPIKGPDLLIEAFARIADAFPAWRLVIAGPDEGMGAQLDAQAVARGVRGRVVMAGALDRVASAAAYRTASLLVVPSRQEAMSLVALEAGAHGTPVLMTDVCGFDDLARAGGGWLVTPSVEGLADGLRRLLTAPSELPRMGERLRALVTARYGWSTVAPRWVELLTDASSRAGARRSPRSSARTPA